MKAGTLVRSAAIQSVGVVASFGTIFVIAAVAGPQGQGQFATYKSLVDLSVAVLTLGIPNGIVYVVNKRLLSAQWLRGLANVLAPVSMAIAGATSCLYLRELGGDAWAREGALLGVSIGATVHYCLSRALILTRSDGAVFAVASALPSVALFAIASVSVMTASFGLATAYAVAAAGTAALSWLALRHLSSRRPEDVAGPLVESPLRTGLRALVEQSSHSFVQGLSQALVPFMLIALMRMNGAGDHEVGIFSIASLANAAPNLLIALIAPVLYNRWSTKLSWDSQRRIIGRTWRFAFLAQVLGLAGAVLAFLLYTYMLPAAFESALIPTCIVAAGVFPLVLSRVWTPVFQATGRTNTVTLAWGTRAITPIALMPLGPLFAHPAEWAALALVAGEYMALIPMLWRLHGSRSGTSAARAS